MRGKKTRRGGEGKESDLFSHRKGLHLRTAECECVWTLHTCPTAPAHKCFQAGILYVVLHVRVERRVSVFAPTTATSKRYNSLV